MSFSIAVQSAVYSALNGVVSVPVYDYVDQDISCPYVTIGEDAMSYADTDTNEEVEATITIHTWSDNSESSRGRKETKTIQGEIYDALHYANLTYSGYNFIVVTEQSATSFIDADGKTYHGVQTFKIIVERV